MDNKTARKIAWTPPEIPVLHLTPESKSELAEEEEPDMLLAELLAAAECDMGCDYPDGPLSPDGCRW